MDWSPHNFRTNWTNFLDGRKFTLLIRKQSTIEKFPPRKASNPSISKYINCCIKVAFIRDKALITTQYRSSSWLWQICKIYISPGSMVSPAGSTQTPTPWGEKNRKPPQIMLHISIDLCYVILHGSKRTGMYGMFVL